MEENISCNVVRDLLPLYVDGAASTGTRKLIALHLEFCEDCQKQCEAMKKKAGRDGMRNSGDAARRKLKRALRLRRAGIGAAIALVVLFTAWLLGNQPSYKDIPTKILVEYGHNEQFDQYGENDLFEDTLYERPAGAPNNGLLESLPEGCVELGRLQSVINYMGGALPGEHLQGAHIDKRYVGNRIYFDPAVNELYLKDPEAGCYLRFVYDRRGNIRSLEECPRKIQYGTAVFSNASIRPMLEEDLPEASVYVGDLQGVQRAANGEPRGHLQGVNLDEGYTGCPLYFHQTIDANRRSYYTALYLEDPAGGYLRFGFDHLAPMEHA